jgi:hypothetical protein
MTKEATEERNKRKRYKQKEDGITMTKKIMKI